mmetsp:Transcript_15385/g.22075  ORF Transcript_15385/g.22075 Transcript_15385/m.22075 type:complete len:215 (+) Transcript_15385:474-1118(+)
MERSLMLLNVHKLTNTPSVTSSGKHNHASKLELEGIRHLSSCDINLDDIVDLNIRVGVTDGTSIVCDNNRYLVRRNEDLVYTAKLVSSLLFVNTVKNETSLGIKKKTESVSALLKLNNIHKSSGEVVVCADLAVNLYTSLHADLHALLVGEGILKTVTENNGEGDTLALLVGTRRGFWGPDAAHFSEVPVVGRIETLQVLLWSARPVFWEGFRL